MEEFQIFPLMEKDLPALVQFCDREIGKNYFNLEALQKALRLSRKAGKTSSLIAYNREGEIIGIRLTFAPGTWMEVYQSGLSPDLWKVEPQYLACFKSLFINAKYQNFGLGKRLSHQAIEILKAQGAQAILCHSTLQSPHNSSQRYLKSMGFIALREHPKFWEHIDYLCTHCGKRPCQCTAVEMILYL